MLNILVLALTVVSVTARYTVPVPIHYEIETQFQKQSNVRNMRWDPTNYLTYLAAVFAQCQNLYSSDGSRIIQKGRVPNATAYNTLSTYFDPSLLQNNLIVMLWDIDSQERQDSGTVDRDIRRITGRLANQPGLGAFPTFDAGGVRSHDRFGCSVETTCKEGDKPVMAFVCIFGQSVPSKQTSGTGETPTQRPQTQPVTRPTPPGLRTTTTRPRPRPTASPTTTTTTTQPPTTGSADAVFRGGLYQTYQEHSIEFYESVMADYEVIQPTTADVVQYEQLINDADICKYDDEPNMWVTDEIKNTLNAELVMYGEQLSPRPTESELLDQNMSNAAKSALRNALRQKLSDTEMGIKASTVACSWALCKKNYLVGCAYIIAEGDEDDGVRRI